MELNKDSNQVISTGGDDVVENKETETEKNNKHTNVDSVEELDEIRYFMKKDKRRLKVSIEDTLVLEDFILNGKYSECLEKLIGHYYNGNLFEKYLVDLIPERIEYRYNNKTVLGSSENHLYDISGIIILGLIVHCYICKNDSLGAFHIIKKFERSCFASCNNEAEQTINNSDHNDNFDNKEMRHHELTTCFISFCNCFSLDIITRELFSREQYDVKYSKHIFKLADIFYFFRIQLIFWKLTMYKSYKIPNISLFQPNNSDNSNSNSSSSISGYIDSINNENVKIDDYCIFYDQSIDELYLLIGEIGKILDNVREKTLNEKEGGSSQEEQKIDEAYGENVNNEHKYTDKLDYDVIFKNWIFKYKAVLLILVEALTLKDYYKEAIKLIENSIEKYFPVYNISLLSMIVRISLQYGNFKLANKIISKMEECIQDPKHNISANVAHYRFTLGLLNMAQDDPVTASLNFNTSAALYKEMAINLNKDYLLSCCVSLNNLSVASFYSSKLTNSISILENQIYNQNNLFSQSQKLFTTNFKNLKTLYQFSPEKDKLINELNSISKNSLKYVILINS